MSWTAHIKPALYFEIPIELMFGGGSSCPAQREQAGNQGIADDSKRYAGTGCRYDLSYVLQDLVKPHVGELLNQSLS